MEAIESDDLAQLTNALSSKDDEPTRIMDRASDDDDDDDDSDADGTEPRATTRVSATMLAPGPPQVVSSTSSSASSVKTSATARGVTSTARATASSGSTVASTTLESHSRITSFPSPVWSAPATSTPGYNPCPRSYSWYNCGFPQAQFVFAGCCSINPCQNNGYCPRWAFAIAAGASNTYNPLTLNEAWAGDKTQAVMTSTHVAGSATELETYTIDGPFPATVLAVPTETTETPAAKSHSGGISGGAAAGIAVGVVAAAFIIAGACGFWWWRRRQAKKAALLASQPPHHLDAGPYNPQMAGMPFDPYKQDGVPPYQDQDFAAKGPGGSDVGSAFAPAEMPATSALTPAELPGNIHEMPLSPVRDTTLLSDAGPGGGSTDNGVPSNNHDSSTVAHNPTSSHNDY